PDHRIVPQDRVTSLEDIPDPDAEKGRRDRGQRPPAGRAEQRQRRARRREQGQHDQGGHPAHRLCLRPTWTGARPSGHLRSYNLKGPGAGKAVHQRRWTRSGPRSNSPLTWPLPAVLRLMAWDLTARELMARELMARELAARELAAWDLTARGGDGAG